MSKEKMLARSLVLIGIYCFATAFIAPVFAQKTHSVNKIVLDAGHGGHDPGCLGKKSKEKDISLSIILKLGKLISEHYKDVQVIYTRDSDKFIELHERANIANRNNADFFISVHCNSGPVSAFGCETYAMGLHKTNDNLNVAKRENSSIYMEDNFTEKYDGFNPASPEANIIFTLYQNAYLDQSLAMASKIQGQFKETAGRSDRGIKQAGFLVLYKTAMPSLLIESGFLTNPDDEAFLNSERGQEKMAESIFKAFSQYKDQYDKKTAIGPKETITPEKKPEDPVKKDQAGNKDPQIYEGDKSPKELEKKPVQVKGSGEKISQGMNTADKPDTGRVEKTAKNSDPDSQPKLYEKPGKTIKSEKETVTSATEEGVKFAVQVASSSSRLSLTSSKFKGLEVKEYQVENSFKYAVGDEKDLSAASALQEEVRKKGFTDAFVIAFFNGNKIPVSQAVKLIKNNKSL